MQTQETTPGPVDSTSVAAADAPRQAPCQAPSRPSRRRRRLAIGLGCVAVLAAIPVGLYFYLTWARQRDLATQFAELDHTDPRWRLEQLLADRPTVPDDENPAIVAWKIQSLLGPGGFDLGSEHDRLFADMDSVHQLNQAQVDALRTALEQQPQALKLARSLKDFQREGRFNITIAPDYISTLIGPLQDCRAIMWMLHLDAMLRAHDEDGDGAVESCRAILVAERAVGDEPYLVAALIRHAGQAVTVGALERVLAHARPSARQLEAMQELLARESEAPILYRALRGERGGCDQLAEALEQGKIKTSALTAGVLAGNSSGIEGWLRNLAPLVGVYGRGELLRLMTETVEAAKLPPEQRAEEINRIDQSVRQSSALLVRVLMPAITNVSESERRQQANLRCAIAALAVELYRIKHARWPETLEAVCKESLLPAVPTDPFDGRPLRYKLLADGLLIYSVGTDGVDNGGNINRERPMDEGVDQGFRLWSVEARRQDPLPPPPQPRDD
jgi:hypothetical protein